MLKLTSLADLVTLDADTIIDVRSPAEYAEDHLPGAINLPVLDNEERARVGTIYKQQSPFLARKIGAALVFRNAAHHVETRLATHDGGWRPLVYCWRGGQRSGAFTWMLKEIGWRAQVLSGGYKSYRRLVVRTLYDAPWPVPVIQLAGYTGTAKTELLARVAHHGVQMLDLEGLARHRGSILGDLAEPQPSQKAFETALAMELQGLDPARPVLVEAESSTIGDITLPPSLWAAMKDAPVIQVKAPLEARARYLSEVYADVLADRARLKEKLHPLRRHRGHALIDGWNDLIDAGEMVTLCRSLAADHYDPAYEKSSGPLTPRVARTISVPALDDPALEAAAARIAAAVQEISSTPARSVI
ncbi:tRNA 2-selenouridine(34) synthase MnmH [Roseovarius aestuariivivens]|uniref:tRNA 2-selenouridine(34) synthase MnmH n=1 Tax=Roseovarius aestuariivivens TaxID=1888910 RepID=UPI00107FFB47|nr:tRNA 2-selenouridine(34) synthase MnmH [Roseovarius aestuariivivens]